MEITELDKQRFFDKVDKNGPTMPRMDTPCWIWLARKAPEGNGLFQTGRPNRQRYQAHHFSWVIHKHNIPRFTIIFHKCNNRICVNPEHLFVNEPANETEKFWRYVNKDGPTMSHMDTPCWVWIGGKEQGYGSFSLSKREKNRSHSTPAHRVSWVIHNGPIPKNASHHGTCVLHKCDNRACINPDHLFLGTQADNIHDMVKKGRMSPPPRNIIVARGSKAGSAKLDETQVIEIRNLYETGKYTYKQLGEMVNLDESSIGRIIRKDNWTHI